MERAAIRRGIRSNISRGCAGGSGDRLLKGREPSLEAILPLFPVKTSLARRHGQTGRQDRRSEGSGHRVIAGGGTHLTLPEVQIALGPVSEVCVFHGFSAL